VDGRRRIARSQASFISIGISLKVVNRSQLSERHS
jgi:hypothetical protein